VYRPDIRAILECRVREFNRTFALPVFRPACDTKPRLGPAPAHHEQARTFHTEPFVAIVILATQKIVFSPSWIAYLKFFVFANFIEAT
jgi:hypothetical protein